MRKERCEKPDRCKNRMISGKFMVSLLAVALLAGGAISGTLAWLTDETAPVTNTFTVGDIDIELTETWNTDTDDDGTDDKWEGKMVPACTLHKDPKVTVAAGSEDCYLFIEITEAGGDVLVGEKKYAFSDFIAYQIDRAWNLLSGVDGVYYRTVQSRATEQEFPVLAAGMYRAESDVEYTWTQDHVLTKPEVTKEMLNEIKQDPNKQPTLTFTAYAVQMVKSDTENFTPEEAWEQVKPNP